MNINQITDQLREFAHDELITLANWCQSEAVKRDPARIAEQKAMAVWREKRDREAEAKDLHYQKVLTALIKLLKPGMMLKMKGCKDGVGIREFIRWDDNDNLVCWQILRRRSWNGKVAVYDQGRTNQVTTHMADKVSRVYVDGTGLEIKSIIK